MIHDTDDRLLTRVAEALRGHGWRPSAEQPVAMLPWPGTFVRLLENGWAAVLTIDVYTREQIELDPWRPGMQEVVDIESAATYPPAEILAGHLGMPPGVDFDVAPPFQSAEDRESLLQFRGPQDHDRVVTEIVAYAEEVLVPAAEDASLERWLAAYAVLGQDDPEVLAREIPVMLAAHGRGDEAIARLDEVRRDPGLPTTELVEHADRLERFVRSGEPLPTDGAELVTMAADRDRRCAVAREEAKARLDAARRELRVAAQVTTAKLAVIAANAGVRALRQFRRDNGGTA